MPLIPETLTIVQLNASDDDETDFAIDPFDADLNR